MIRVSKSKFSKNVFISQQESANKGIFSGATDDVVYERDGDLFSIDNKSDGIYEVYKVSYDQFEGINDEDEIINFQDADAFENYLQIVLKNEELTTKEDNYQTYVHSSDGLVNQTFQFEPFFLQNNDAGQDILIENGICKWTVPVDGLYLINTQYSFSTNSSGSDFIGRLLVNGQEYFTCREEMKDTSGDGTVLPIVTGGLIVGSIDTSTFQRKNFNRDTPFLFEAGQEVSITLQWRGESNNIQAAIYEALILIKRIS